MKEIIKTFKARYGEVKLERYDENGKTEYHVIHSNPNISNSWYDNKSDAIRHYQFLCGKY